MVSLQSRSFRFLLCSCAAVTLLSPLDAHAARIMSPADNWSIEAGHLELSGEKSVSYCSISNRYGDDARLEFYGASGRLAALKLDLPGQVLKAGDTHEVTLRIPGPYKAAVSGAAVDERTLMLNVKRDMDLPLALTHGTILYVGFKGEEHAFSLSGIKDFNARMRDCKDSVRPRVAARPAAPVSDDPVALHAAARDTLEIINNDGGEGAPEERATISSPVNIEPFPKGYHNPGPRPERVSYITAEAFAPIEDGKPMPRPAFATGQREAITEISASEDLAPVHPQPGVQPQAGPVELYAGASQAFQEPQVIAEPPKTWQALKGADVREVLSLWSQENGVELIWDSVDQFDVRESVKAATSYEAAVEKVLSQYDGVPGGLPRPVGRLHMDSQTGQTVLLVQSERIL